MDVFGIDISSIVELGTQVATNGAIRMGEVAGDDIFHFIVSLAILVYEIDPG